MLEGSNGSTRIDKTGRPAWFAGFLAGDVPGLGGRGAGMSASMAQRNRKQRARCMRLSVIVGGGLLVIGAFVFALGQKVGVSPHAIYDYMGDKWYGDSGVIPFEFNNLSSSGLLHHGRTARLCRAHDEDSGGTDTHNWSVAIQTTIPGFQDANFKPFEHMGPLTPYLSSSGWGVDDAKYAGTPTSSSGKTCQLTQAHMLHRHGARSIRSTRSTGRLARLSPTEPILTLLRQPLVLNDYKFGGGRRASHSRRRGQLYDSGVKAALLYGKLVADDWPSRTSTANQDALRASRQSAAYRRFGTRLAQRLLRRQLTDTTSFEIQIEELVSTPPPLGVCLSRMARPGKTTWWNDGRPLGSHLPARRCFSGSG